MKCVNLIPAPRREAKSRRTHLLKWAIGFALYVGLLIAAWFVCSSYSGSDGRGLTVESRRLSAKLSGSNRIILALHQELAQAEQKLRSARAVGEQPNWGVLLALLAKNLGDELVLGHCKLVPVEGAQRDSRTGKTIGPEVKTGPAATPNRQYLLDLGGFARSQAAASGFVLRLERTGLFDQVRPIKTSRQTLLNSEAVAFHVECLLGGNEGAAD